MDHPESSQPGKPCEPNEKTADASDGAGSRVREERRTRDSQRARGGSVRFTCPHCGYVSRIDRQYLGQSGPCVNCGGRVTISRETGAEIEEPAANVRLLAIMLGLGVVTVVTFIAAGFLIIPYLSWTSPEGMRLRSKVRLLQVGQAIHSHAAEQNQFPATSEFPAQLPASRRVSWVAPLLPYLDQGELYFRVDPENAVDAGINASAATSPLVAMQCATNPPAQPYLSNFVGIAGLGSDAASLPLEDKRAGAFGDDRRVSFADVKDGLSNTMFVAETHMSLGPWLQGGSATVRGVDINQRPYIGKYQQFGSERGCLILLGDGSVRDLNPRISPEVFEAMSTIAGGESFGPPPP